jgi:hypothetical protein
MVEVPDTFPIAPITELKVFTSIVTTDCIDFPETRDHLGVALVVQNFGGYFRESHLRAHLNQGMAIHTQCFNKQG